MEYLTIKKGEQYRLDVKWDTKKYKVYIKSFNDESHYENWVDFIQERGGKVIGINYINK
tara:strand:- start:468 stop:644 length:177 start_codon:yes stop_codon:yes gene_type:complete